MSTKLEIKQELKELPPDELEKYIFLFSTIFPS